MAHPITVPVWKRILGTIAFLFAALTLFKSGQVIFGPQSARDAVGDFVPFVVQFNFVAGFFYLLAGIGIFLGRGWSMGLSALIALATLVTTAFFARHLLAGGAFEMQTVGALGIRSGFWIFVTLILWRTGRHP